MTCKYHPWVNPPLKDFLCPECAREQRSREYLKQKLQAEQTVANRAAVCAARTNFIVDKL